MRNALLVILVFAAISAGGYYALGQRRQAPNADVLRLSEPPSQSIALVCVHCRCAFRQIREQAVAGRQGFMACPECGKPTPVSSRQTAR